MKKYNKEIKNGGEYVFSFLPQARNASFVSGAGREAKF
jgi:hypothetical protein